MKKKSKKPVIGIIILILVLLIIAAGIIVHKVITRTRFNDSIVYGNSAGNFYNGGLFCEYEDTVYFSNPKDGYKLYGMTASGDKAHKISDDAAAYINADSNYLYYARNNGVYTTDFSFLRINTNSLCRIDHNGKNVQILEKDPVLYASLAGNYIYYIHYDKETASTLYKVKIDGKERGQVSAGPMLLSPGSGGKLCFSGAESDHFIRSFDPNTDSSSAIYECVSYNPVDTGDSVYFMDGENDYHVTRYDKSTGTLTELTDCRVDTFNLTNTYVYYQRSDADNPALCRIPKDGSGEEEIISPGTYCDINVTSQYVYFRSFQAKDSFFQTPAEGPANVSAFSYGE